MNAPDSLIQFRILFWFHKYYYTISLLALSFIQNQGNTDYFWWKIKTCHFMKNKNHTIPKTYLSEFITRKSLEKLNLPCFIVPIFDWMCNIFDESKRHNIPTSAIVFYSRKFNKFRTTMSIVQIIVWHVFFVLIQMWRWSWMWKPYISKIKLEKVAIDCPFQFI